MRILALDMATKTGWAVSGGASGVWDLSIRKDESSGMRLIRFESKLYELVFGGGLTRRVDLIVFEAVTVGAGPRANFDAIKLATKLQAIVERLVASIDDLECRSYNLNEIKRHAIPEKGKRRDKAAMVEAARDRWPDADIEDDNVADALFLLSLAQKELGIGG
ncbi:MAG: hypothetical protein ABID40_03545 [Candidatus Bipolaricaulota bacterium]